MQTSKQNLSVSADRTCSRLQQLLTSYTTDANSHSDRVATLLLCLRFVLLATAWKRLPATVTSEVVTSQNGTQSSTSCTTSPADVRESLDTRPRAHVSTRPL